VSTEEFVIRIPRPHPIARWVLPVVLVAAFCGLKLAVGPDIFFGRSPWVLMSGAVTLAAWYGGGLPGVATTMLSLITCTWLFVPHRAGHLFPDDPGWMVRGIAFAIDGLLVSAVAASLHRARGEAERLKSEADRLNGLKDVFLATVSHELRSPLHAILGWTRVLATGKLDAERQERALGSIERNALLQSKLVEDLLDVSRAVTGTLRVEKKVTPMCRVALDALESLRLEAEEKRIRLESDVQDGAVVLGDPARLNQVVTNLLRNAIKFTPPGGHVHLQVARDEREVRLTVADDGDGIEPDLLPVVFDRFRQGKGAFRGPSGGLGLGLAIVRYVVEMHGGSVEARSDGPGRGATFQVRLPALAGAGAGADAGVGACV
jgi:signal transduction histidine kinase